MKASKVSGFERVYEIPAFSSELADLFSDDKVDHKKYVNWLLAKLKILEINNSPLVPGHKCFEKLNVSGIPIYSVTKRRKKNTRALYYYHQNGVFVLLSAFDEKGNGDYRHHIPIAQKRAQAIGLKEEN